MKKYAILGVIVTLTATLLSGCTGYSTPQTTPVVTTPVVTTPVVTTPVVTTPVVTTPVATTPVATTPGATTPPSSVSTVTISNFSFSPSTLIVKVGTTVTWTNKDSVTHTVTSDNGAFAGGNLASNGTFSFTFVTPGTFAYHCAIHPSMTGTVVVQ